MTRLPRFCRTLAVGLAAAAATLSLTQVANAEPAAPTVPPQIFVDPGVNKVFLIGHARGFQIYTCTGPGIAPSSPVTPDAQLFGDNGQLIANHFGTPSGPAWQARDGSKVVGKRDGGVNVDTSAIDWLRVVPVSTTAGPDGDRLAGTSFIQRIKTTGGLAASVAGQCTTAGQQVKAQYTADYVFWKKIG
jgi:hypothetical protein